MKINDVKSTDLTKELKVLSNFIGRQQMSAIKEGLKGEESEHFVNIVKEYAERVTKMHKVYEQDGKGDEAIVHLHYFKGSMDWYITERDISQKQHQAFGIADLGYGAEMGYISIQELIDNNVELDLYFKPVAKKKLNLKN